MKMAYKEWKRCGWCGIDECKADENATGCTMWPFACPNNSGAHNLLHVSLSNDSSLPENVKYFSVSTCRISGVSRSIEGYEKAADCNGWKTKQPLKVSSLTSPAGFFIFYLRCKDVLGVICFAGCCFLSFVQAGLCIQDTTITRGEKM